MVIVAPMPWWNYPQQLTPKLYLVILLLQLLASGMPAVLTTVPRLMKCYGLPTFPTLAYLDCSGPLVVPRLRLDYSGWPASCNQLLPTYIMIVPGLPAWRTDPRVGVVDRYNVARIAWQSLYAIGWTYLQPSCSSAGNPRLCSFWCRRHTGGTVTVGWLMLSYSLFVTV